MVVAEVISMKQGPKKRVSVLLPMDVYLALQPLAKENYRSLAGYIRETLRQHLRDQPACQDDSGNQTIIKLKQSPGR